MVYCQWQHPICRLFRLRRLPGFDFCGAGGVLAAGPDGLEDPGKEPSAVRQPGARALG